MVLARVLVVLLQQQRRQRRLQQQQRVSRERRVGDLQQVACSCQLEQEE
jgi:predicted membrane chloride channel (bestrophin family)